MSQVDRYKPYKGAAAGWGALISVTKSWLGSENALKNIRAMLKTNQNGGFDCPGCAWGESPESGMVKFCENGAKAVNWEATGRLVNPAFLNKYTVSTLSESLGVGKGTVVFDDLEHADAIFVIGQNPGTNHPRMLEPLREAVKRGAQVICINPLKERGLERFPASTAPAGDADQRL